MSSFSLIRSFLSEDQFQCSICLDVFTNPASTPCGHSFCMACISRYWDGAKACQCPICKETYRKRPDLTINRTLREITDQFKAMTGGSRGGGQRRLEGAGGGGGGGGDDLFQAELRARLPRYPASDAKSGALPIPPPPSSSSSSSSSSYLATSVPNSRHTHTPPPPPPPPHPPAPPSGPAPSPPLLSRSSTRRRFTVSGAGDSRAPPPVCAQHRRGLLTFCQTCGAAVCPDCERAEHQGHDTMPLERAWLQNKTQLNTSEQEIEEMIRQRLRKVDEIRLSVADVQRTVERETSVSMCVFSELACAVERSQAELLEVIEMSRRSAEHQADLAVAQLEHELAELRRRGHALNELSQSGDYVHCIKTFPSLSSPPPVRDWSGVSVTSDLGTRGVYQTLAVAMERFLDELRRMADKGFPVPPEMSPARREPKVKKVQEYAVNVTLDSSTAHPRLILSEDMKRVKCGDRHQPLPDNPERFDRVVCVLGREAFSTGRYYWEVEVGGKTDWDLGVASRSINRKGKIDVNPSNGYWFLSLRDKNTYAFRSEPSTEVPVNLRPQKIGVFLDYEKGQVSFFNVEAKQHIYTFMDTFSESIFPFFSPCTNKSGKNEGPLIITPINTD